MRFYVPDACCQIIAKPLNPGRSTARWHAKGGGSEGDLHRLIGRETPVQQPCMTLCACIHAICACRLNVHHQCKNSNNR